MIHYSRCPSSGGTDLSPRNVLKDYSISGESFPVTCCNACGLVFTQDIPDEDEIVKYYQSEKYISHSDTSKGVINRLYHLVRKITLRSKRNLIRRTTKIKSGSILDIGSGTGSFLNTMKSAGWVITGIEPDVVARKNAGILYGIDSLTPDRIEGLSGKSYDVITMWHVLEHVHQLDKQMRGLCRLIRDDGVILIAVPNHTSWDAAYYQNYWAAWDVPRHLYHFSPESIGKLCENYGLEVVDIRPMWFDSFYVSMLSEKYKTKKGNILKALIIGLVSNIKALADKKRCSSVTYVLKKIPAD